MGVYASNGSRLLRGERRLAGMTARCVSDAWPDDGALRVSDAWSNDGALRVSDAWSNGGALRECDAWPDGVVKV